MKRRLQTADLFPETGFFKEDVFTLDGFKRSLSHYPAALSMWLPQKLTAITAAVIVAALVHGHHVIEPKSCLLLDRRGPRKQF
ncbi:MAG: hypothetical protein AAF283_08930 [Cyanobacteria bacterium P01_A01_bin.70]